MEGKSGAAAEKEEEGKKKKIEPRKTG